MSRIKWSGCYVVEKHLDANGRTVWPFRGTAVPVRVLFDRVLEGGSAWSFAEEFPSVTVEQARAALFHSIQPENILPG